MTIWSQELINNKEQHVLHIYNEVIPEEYREIEEDTDKLLAMISMEDDSVSLEGLVGDLAVGISDSLGSSMKSISGVMSRLNPFSGSDLRDLQNKSEEYMFSEISIIPMTIPESFSGFVVDYSKDVMDIHKRYKSSIIPTLKKHKAKLATLLNSGQYESNVHYSKDFRNNATNLKKDKALFNKYYPKNTGKQSALVKNIYGGWSEILEQHTIASNKNMLNKTDKAFLDLVLKEVGEVNELLLRLRDDIRSDNNKKRTRTLKDIAGGIYTLAQEVDFFSTMVFETTVIKELTEVNESKILDFEGDK